jgi:hypothetical protein
MRDPGWDRPLSPSSRSVAPALDARHQCHEEAKVGRIEVRGPPGKWLSRPRLQNQQSQVDWGRAPALQVQIPEPPGGKKSRDQGHSPGTPAFLKFYLAALGLELGASCPLGGRSPTPALPTAVSPGSALDLRPPSWASCVWDYRRPRPARVEMGSRPTLSLTHLPRRARSCLD